MLGESPRVTRSSVTSEHFLNMKAQEKFTTYCFDYLLRLRKKLKTLRLFKAKRFQLYHDKTYVGCSKLICYFNILLFLASCCSRIFQEKFSFNFHKTKQFFSHATLHDFVHFQRLNPFNPTLSVPLRTLISYEIQ